MNNTCPHCGDAMQMFSADEDWCPKCKHCIPGSSSNKDRELAALRSQNRDLQQAYDHVLECEQNRCREVVELQDQLKEVTSERDELSTRLHDELVLGSRLKCDFVLLKNERDELRRRIDEAPVWYMENGGFVSEYAASFRTDKQRLTRVRLVRDDQPGEADA